MLILKVDFYVSGSSTDRQGRIVLPSNVRHKLVSVRLTFIALRYLNVVLCIKLYCYNIRVELEFSLCRNSLSSKIAIEKIRSQIYRFHAINNSAVNSNTRVVP